MSSPSSRHDNRRSRRFISRHQTLLAVVLGLGVAIGALTVGQSWNVSSAKRASDRMSGGKQGRSVSLSAGGNTAIVRGPFANNAAGAARVFTPPTNDPPTITNNTGITVSEGSTVNPIDNTKLLVNDVDNTAAELTYTIDTAPTHGTLKKSGSATSTFTQADIDSSAITYDHDGSETTSDSFMFSVSDGAGGSISSTAFNITVTPTNDPPTIANNTGITVNEGSSGNPIGSAQLSVTDPDNTAVQLTYTVGTAPTHGTLKKSGSATSTFTQADIDSSAITYDHDGSETTSDSFMFSVSDGAGGSISSTAFNITVTPTNDNPTIATNTGTTVNEGSTVNVIGSAQLSVTDNDNTAAQLTYTVGTAPTNGTLKKSGSGLSGGSTFTQADINSSLITYDHDGSETTADSFTFTVSDGAGGSIGSTAFNITITPTNDNPTLTTNGGLTVVRGHSGTIDNTKLLVSDPDNTAGQLTFTIGTATTHGTLKKSSTALAASDTFTQDDINNNLITYQHNGDGATADSFTFTVSDGAGGSIGLTTFNITINCVASPVVTSTSDSGNGTLRDAILGACTNATITFDPALTSGGPATITLTSAELAIDKNLTINGPTNNGLTISGNNARRVFNINAGVNLLFSNLTIANGKASTGGGILNAGTLLITGSTISGNKTTDGADASGASNGGNAGNGGGINNSGTLTLISSTLGGNQTGRGGDNLSGTTGNGGNSGSGAGIFSTGTVLLTNTTVTDNQNGRPGHVAPTDPAPPGIPGTTGTCGGVVNSGGTLTANNTILANNRDGFGGEDDINGAVNSSSSFNFVGVDTGFTGISNGTNGNKIGAFDSPLSPHLNALANNGGPTQTYLPQSGSPVIDAGSNALAKDQSNNDLTTDQRGTGFPRIINGTVEIGAVESTEAPAPPGADLTVSKSASVDQVVPDRDITYTITVNNNGSDPATSVSMSDTLPQVTTSADVDPFFPTFASTTFVSLTSPAGWSCVTPSVGSGGTISCTRASFGGSGTQSFTLIAHVPPGAVPNSDFPFISNTVAVSAANDINTENDGGSASTLLFACFSNPVVTTSADSGVGSLRQAIADACVGDTITFDMTPGHVTSPITLTSGELVINKGLTITGPNTLTISGNNLSRIFNINAGAATVSISGLTLRDGKPVGGTAGGGAILINNGASAGPVNLTGLTITNNDVSMAGNPLGGGIDNDGGVVTIDRCSIVNNVATFRGGAIQSQGFGSMVITNSTIAGNTAGTTGIGGGIRSLLPLTLTNDTIFGNSAQTGGNVSRSGGTITFGNTIIAGGILVGSGGSGPDINGPGFSSADFNLIQDTSTGTITGTTTNNITGVSPNLQALGNNGGTTPTLLPKPGSPVINAGDTALVSGTDQRAFSRFIGGRADIGAVETSYTITATAGTPQSTIINAPFATALKANVSESGNNQTGVPVTFTPPGSGASGVFAGSATVNTDASGVATAPTFTANGTAGGPYNVVASIGTGLPNVSFALTNNKATTATAVTASPNPSNSGQSVTFTATVTSASGTPTGTVQFKDGGTNLGSAQALNGSGVATFATSSLTGGLHTITAEYSGDANFIASTGTLAVGQQVGAIINFSSATFGTTESSRSATITVTRSGETTSAVTVDYATPDDSAATPTILPCSTPGFVSARCDFTTAIGTLRFAANETTKTFVVLISQDNYVEGAEAVPLTLSNPSANAGLGTPFLATLTIADDVSEPAANPIDDSTNFVRQHYHDFLNREPDPTDLAGLNFWVNQIESCGADQACRDLRRQNVSAAFFLSIEFQQTGYYVYRTYKTAFADINPPTVPVPIRYREFVRDTQLVQTGVIVGQGAWQAQLDANKQAYALAFVKRPEFIARYPAITPAAAFVDTLNTNAGSVLTPAERTSLISGLAVNPADDTLRANVLMTIAENTLLKQQEMNRAFVLMQYFGYLRRNPDAAPEPGLNFTGFNFWLNKLNSFNGNFVNADMVKAFITSSEYRKRSGQ